MSVFPSTASRVVVTLLKKTGRGHLKFFASLGDGGHKIENLLYIDDVCFRNEHFYVFYLY